jgi:hypothetical protein
MGKQKGPTERSHKSYERIANDYGPDWDEPLTAAEFRVTMRNKRPRRVVKRPPSRPTPAGQADVDAAGVEE